MQHLFNLFVSHVKTIVLIKKIKETRLSTEEIKALRRKMALLLICFAVNPQPVNQGQSVTAGLCMSLSFLLCLCLSG